MAGTLRGALAGSIVASPLWTTRMRGRLLRVLGVRLGRGTRVYPGILFLGGTDTLRVGAGCFLNAQLTVGANAPVTIEDRVFIGPRVTLVPTTHELGPSHARAGATLAGPITIGAGTWIGAGATILGGVTVGPGCVIAAGAVVVEDCDADGLYGGVPARLIRALDA